MNHRVRRNPRLGPPDGLRSDGASLVVPAMSGHHFLVHSKSELRPEVFLPDAIEQLLPAQYLGHTAVGDLEYPGDVAGPGPAVGQLHDLLSGGVRQGPPVDIDPA